MNSFLLIITAIPLATSFQILDISDHLEEDYPANYDHVIESPLVTNWGDWGPLELCPEGTFASGMQLKVESPQGRGDDTAVNGVRLLCMKPGTDDFDNATAITSSIQEWGSWGTTLRCDHGVILGFQLNSQPYQDSGDDSAANNVRIFCSNLLSGRYLEGDGHDWGTWTKPQLCMSKQAVCGIQTQIEPYIGEKDDTALNNVKMKCCGAPNIGLTCSPTDSWETILECDNTAGVEPLLCTYQKTKGITKSGHSSEQYLHEYELMLSLGFTADLIYSGLSANFRSNFNYSETTKYSWASESSETWNEATTITAAFTVPGGMKSKLSQAVGDCGYFSIFSSYFKKEDFDGDDCQVDVKYIVQD